MSVLVPLQVGLAGALDLELDAPPERHFRVGRVAPEVETDGDAGALPLAESVADGIDERRLKVGDGPRRDVDAHGPPRAVVPTMQHRILTRRDDLIEVGDAGARPDAAARFRTGQGVHVRAAGGVQSDALGGRRGGRRLGRRRRPARRVGRDRLRHGNPRLRRNPVAHEDVPEYRERHQRDGRGDQGGEPTLDHARNMSKRAARPLALPLCRLYDCGPAMSRIV